MRHSFSKRIGQSRAELMLAIVFSCFLHVLVALAAVFLYIKASPKIYVPPFYQVKLVSQPVELPETPPPQETVPLPQKEKQASQKQVATPKVVKVIPQKATQPQPAEEKPAQQAKELPSVATGSVTVTAPQMDEKFSWYIGLLRARIEPNWKPTPDAKDARARVLFTINRSGWVTEVNLDTEHATGTFEFKQAAIRAIRASNPFPPLPEEFPRQALEFSVDLVPKQ